ncbi:hypothetical protein CES85_1594 [Ochrobactrum quorumnocens]|uniref:Uncharacterized protein n=1 Tax=Ochrobactrum quorumnocens TaxID=271865 RepID=A0A248UET1_9HYPH|nr:hypothetical protein CES85_1594 [[Ochrobactrum] quorumnocens]
MAASVLEDRPIRFRSNSSNSAKRFYWNCETKPKKKARFSNRAFFISCNF